MHLYALGFWTARPAPILSDLLILQGFADRASPPASRTEGRQNGGNGSFLDVFRASVHWCKRRGETRPSTRPGFWFTFGKLLPTLLPGNAVPSALIAGIGFDFCPRSGRYWRKSWPAIVLRLSSLASMFAFLGHRSRVRRFLHGTPCLSTLWKFPRVQRV